MDYASAVNEEIRDLFAAGADVVQIDEPYMQARPEKAREYGLAAAVWTKSVTRAGSVAPNRSRKISSAAAAASSQPPAPSHGAQRLPATAAGPTTTAAPGAKAALTVNVVSPQAGQWTSALPVNGSIAAWDEAPIGSETAGLRLVEVRASVGDKVRQGATLAVTRDVKSVTGKMTVLWSLSGTIDLGDAPRGPVGDTAPVGVEEPAQEVGRECAHDVGDRKSVV